MKTLLIEPYSSCEPYIHFLPLGVAYTAGTLREMGIDVDIIDFLNYPSQINNKKLTSYIKIKKRYDAIMVGGILPQIRPMKEIIQVLRKQVSCPIIVGGTSMHGIPDRFLKYTGADVAVLGDSEVVLAELMENLGKSLGDIQGIAFWRDGEVIVNRAGNIFLEDLSKGPRPAYDMFDIEFIAPRSFNRFGAKRSMHLFMSRGCPYSCNFCIESAHLCDRYRTLPHEIMESEIRWFQREYGVNDFHMVDEEFLIDREAALSHCRLFKNLGITWSTSTRIDHLDEDILNAMIDSGCHTLLVGLESVSNRVLKAMNKGYDSLLLQEKVSLLRDYQRRLNISYGFVSGYHDETLKEMLESIRFAYRNNIFFTTTIYRMYPNTKDFERYSEKIEDLDNYLDTLSNTSFFNEFTMNFSKMKKFTIISFKHFGTGLTAAKLLLKKFEIQHKLLLAGLTILLTPFLSIGSLLYYRLPASVQNFIREITLYIVLGGKRVKGKDKCIYMEEAKVGTPGVLD